MKDIGLAMYTVHRSAQKDLPGTFEQLAEMGYRGVEFYGDFEAFDRRAICAALDGSGLDMWGWHVEWRELQADRFARTVDMLHDCRCPAAVVPCLGGRWEVGHTARQECLQRWLVYADELAALHEKLKTEGIALGYHNHDHEFSTRYEGKPVFHWLFDRLPQDVRMELDTGNCIEGGGDPVQTLGRYAGRGVLLHMKPYSFEDGFHVTLGDEKDENDWPAILQAPGVRFERIMVESEAEHLPEMENARRCLEAAKRMMQI